MNITLSRLLRRALPVAGLLATASAGAHTGVDAGSHHGLLSGFAHPITGLDHLAAMIGVGLWSAISAPAVDRRMLWAPLSFALMLLAGALLGYAGIELPAVEPMIAASVLLLGLLATARLALPGAAAAALVGAFAVFHGVAHGLELGQANAGLAALAGMVMATALLHGTGLAIGITLRERNVWLPRLAGTAVTLFGAALVGGWA
ncbi:urease accessory protein [Sphaerotilus hippei]|uniref:Urease accessory protein n=1 Tax=Sphaerotilus hippei TaxID=744406 RepID=A0A318H6H0_9BURK|nr:HupE/UreJ family protein [Sphaerotilus hippei]PXW92868.1 urease accessory protein [Sphaerotilus hippei]